MVQVENEYGSYGTDKPYVSAIREDVYKRQMRFRNSHTKHIQDRFVQSDDGCLFRAFQVKNDDFIRCV